MVAVFGQGPSGQSPLNGPQGAPVEVAGGQWDADSAVTALYTAHYASLVRLSALLLRDSGAAEEVVQDAFVAMHGAWRRIREEEKALAYLRRTVVNRSRSVLRRRVVAERHAPTPGPDMPSAEHGALARIEGDRMLACLRTLPPRQREALVLRYYADLSEAEIAAAMKVSRGSVKTHSSRGIAALRAQLGAGPDAAGLEAAHG